MRYRSFFWPAVLILVGVVALLVNTGQIALDRLVLLTDLWPLTSSAPPCTWPSHRTRSRRSR